MIKYKNLQQTRSMCPSLRGSSEGATTSPLEDQGKEQKQKK